MRRHPRRGYRGLYRLRPCRERPDLAVQTDSAVLLLRQICNGELLADAPRTRQEHVIRFDELPGAKIIGRAVEVRHIFEWAKKGTDNEEE